MFRSVLDWAHSSSPRRLAHGRDTSPPSDVLESASPGPGTALPTWISWPLPARCRDSFATYREKEDLIAVGAYREGTSPIIDRAVRMRDPINRFLQQTPGEPSTFDSARANMLDRLGRQDS